MAARREIKSEEDLLRALDELGRSMAGGLDLRRLATAATGVIRQRLGLAYVALVLVDYANGRAEYLGDSTELPVAARPGDTQPLDRGLVGLCAREGRTVYVEDVRRDPNYVQIIPGIVTELVIPVRSRERVVAVLNCESREPGGLRGRGMFLEVAADRLGAAMENALLLREKAAMLEQVQAHAQYLEVLCQIARIATQDLELRPMLQRITDALSQAFGWEFVSCATVDFGRGRFVNEAVTSRVATQVTVGYGRELGSGVVGTVAKTGGPILIDDVRGIPNYVETMPGCRSELCVPVMSGGRVVAVLNLESLQPAAFHDQLLLLQTVAEQVAGAIASAHLFAQVKRRALHLAMIGELSRHAMGAGELQPLMDRVVDYVHRRMGLPFVAILLLDESGNEMELAAHAGAVPLSVARGARWPVGSGIVGRAIRSGEPQLVANVKADPDYVAIAPDIVAELAVPISFQGRTLGVMNVEVTAAEALGPETVMVLRTFVDQTAGAIHMAAVNRRLADTNRALTGALSRYVAPDVAERLAADPQRFHSSGERRDATVLFADVRGFGALGREMDPEQLLTLLNDALGKMGEAVLAERGSINRFLGDGFLAVFGVPERLPGHAAAAVRAAIEIQKRVDAMSPRWEAATGSPLSVAVAVHTGDVISGSVGDARHREFTVLGDVVAVASRLEAEAKAKGARILVTGAVADALGGRVPVKPAGSLDLGSLVGAHRLYMI